MLPALVHDDRDVMLQAQRFEARDGRPLCPVACVSEQALEVMAREADAREYGLRRQVSRKELIAYRIVRGERGTITAEMHAEMKDEMRNGR